MTEILSLWRSPLDQVAFSEAAKLRDRQARCSISYGEDFGAMTIYNYGYYISIPMSPDDALTQMFEDMSAANPIGGIAFVSQTTLSSSLTASASGFAVPDQCNIIGSGGGGSGTTPFYHFTIDYAEGSLFLSCSGNYTSGGKYFRSLAFRGTSLQSGSDTCIYAEAANCRAVNCTFTDIPVAFNAQGDGCALEQCTIDYDGRSGTSAAPITAAIIAGAQCAILGPGEFEQRPQSEHGPAYCTGVSIEGAEHTVVADIHLSDWNIGVDFGAAAGATDTEIRNCEIQSEQTALSIRLPSDASTATCGVKVTSCMLAKTNDSSTYDPTGHAVVVIDPQGSSNDLLDDITLLDCTVFTMGSTTILGQHGLNIVGGSNIKIIGGTYSNNSSNAGAGIAITGPCGDVQIIGANLQPTYPWAGTTMGSSLNDQQYGLLVSGGPTGTIYVSNCDLTGYTNTTPYVQQAVVVTGTAPHELLISNCPGYNDQSTSIQTTPPTSSASASSPGAGGTPYFGPSVFIFSNSSAVNLYMSGQTISTSFGIIYLPSPYDSFYFIMTGPTVFLWIGK